MVGNGVVPFPCGSGRGKTFSQTRNIVIFGSERGKTPFQTREVNEKKEKEEKNEKLEREKKMQKAMLDIKKKYGKNAILKGMNLQEDGTAMERNRQIGGHKA